MVLAAPRMVASASFIRRLSCFAPDLNLVATFEKKLSPELLSVPNLAAINVHASKLPKYRGTRPEFWVLRNGERETGMTFHYMTPRFDDGLIVAQSSVPIVGGDDLLTLS